MGMEAIFKLITSRALPQPNVDTMPDVARGSRYGELGVSAPIRKQHLLADEGSYFVVNNAQTGIATATQATIATSKPIAIIANVDSPGNPAAKRIYLDYIHLYRTAAGAWVTGGVNEQIAVYVDTGDAYGSAGTDLTSLIVSPNMDMPARSSIAKVRFGGISGNTLSNAARCIVGLRTLRQAVSATVAGVVGECSMLNFGGVESAVNGSVVVANATFQNVPLPPIVIGPGQCCVILYALNGTTPSAASFAPEIGWWER